MGSLCSTPSPQRETIVQQQQTNRPEWVTREGEQLYGEARPLADRPYPEYPVSGRLAPFNPDQIAGFDIGRADVGAWEPAFNSAFMGAGASAMPVGAEDISRYMNPYTDEVIGSVREELNRQYERDRINRNAAMVGRGSYLTEDRREVINNLARESRDRNLGGIVGALKSDAYNAALGQANTERGRTADAARMYAELGPLRMGLGAGDVAMLENIGGQQQGQAQTEMSLSYEDFLQGFYYPQEQENWLLGMLSGIPTNITRTTEGDQLIPQANPLAQGIGGAAAIAGMGNNFGWWG
jgi:hypothetical protein